jgi:hypothetical protein
LKSTEVCVDASLAQKASYLLALVSSADPAVSLRLGVK